MTQPNEPPFKKETGFRHFLAAARYSWQGFWRLVKESAFRQELAAFFGGLLILLFWGVGLDRLLIFTVLMLILFAVEALNTAVEELVDRVSPEYSKAGKHAKDLGSFAVACLIGANAIYFLWALFF
ncbi:diacylglycerol kinase [Rhizobium sp. L1K21]|uniref:diacylglycerol kinase n=1 Tax=Rhizobium sp. L1K21 TaxID=2954933 RepID=UPI002093E732|nr:diacylglycerol kinase [Rhizobium sp. L1K21]MCO6186242.1 diacylglycerol kinase [Rhizobium sp. L1K21]